MVAVRAGERVGLGNLLYSLGQMKEKRTRKQEEQHREQKHQATPGTKRNHHSSMLDDTVRREGQHWRKAVVVQTFRLTVLMVP